MRAELDESAGKMAGNHVPSVVVLYLSVNLSGVLFESVFFFYYHSPPLLKQWKITSRECHFPAGFPPSHSSDKTQWSDRGLWNIPRGLATRWNKLVFQFAIKAVTLTPGKFSATEMKTRMAIIISGGITISKCNAVLWREKKKREENAVSMLADNR